MEDIYKSLCEIQAILKAPKNQRNSFGNYNYRSCEDIIEAVKPLLHERTMFLLMSDEVVNIGNKNYVQATASIYKGNQSISSSAYAREAESRKGMDDSQITGATSSYARKYALNGLFAIDDTKDADTMDNLTESKQEEKKHAEQNTNHVAEAMITVIELINSKDHGHKWRKDNQAEIDKLGADKSKVMTAYFNKMKEFN